MPDFKYTLEFNTSTKEDSLKVMNAVTQIIRSVSVEDLEYIAKISKAKPGWVKKAKPYENFL